MSGKSMLLRYLQVLLKLEFGHDIRFGKAQLSTITSYECHDVHNNLSRDCLLNSNLFMLIKIEH